MYLDVEGIRQTSPVFADDGVADEERLQVEGPEAVHGEAEQLQCKQFWGTSN